MTKQLANLLLRLFIVWLSAAILVCGADPWTQVTSRKPAEWSQAEVERLLNDSPWSLPVPAVMDDPGDQTDVAPAPMPTPEQSGTQGRSNQGAARWDGGIGKNRMGRLPTIPVTVRWESAGIMQAALLQAHKPLTDGLAAATGKSYVLSVAGLIPAHRYHSQTLIGSKKSSSGDPDPSDPEEVLESFMAKTRMTFKGGSIQPENVRLDADTGTIHIFFPKADISQRTHEILFVTSFGSMHVQAKFRLKDMAVQGKLDL
jgi:hypothetical protein